MNKSDMWQDGFEAGRASRDDELLALNEKLAARVEQLQQENIRLLRQLEAARRHAH